MYVSLQRGHIIEESITQPTLSDGTAGGIEPGSLTFGYCQQYIDDLLLVKEAEIADAIRWTIQNRQMIIEGSAGLSIATLLREREQFEGKNVVLIISGKRLSWEKLQKILQDG